MKFMKMLGHINSRWGYCQHFVSTLSTVDYCDPVVDFALAFRYGNHPVYYHNVCKATLYMFSSWDKERAGENDFKPR